MGDDLNLNQQTAGEEQAITDEQNIESSQEQPSGEKGIKEFDPENVEFNGSYHFSGYDLSNFEGSIDLNDDSIQALDAYSKKFSELGMTQEQVEGVIGLMIASETESQTPEAIMKALDKGLTYEEKRAYKANCNLLKQALHGTEEEKFFHAITSDPVAVKILGKVIGHIRGGANVNGARTEREVRNTGRMLTGQQGLDDFENFMKSSAEITEASIEAKKKEIRSKLANEQELNYFNQILG